ncbi:hypothetical protein CYMTET_13176 [Cymbomonas tetramitiformis]|uniref:Uncharacterized protein n=1 Tax=Cymbomonas tetramitiformis TaxID=36881 RepID=A0AAE0GK69_9CHLO|nr:hypothetical protein CYMTET_13176 [Cymbomonas tetramitiformis]
MREEVHSRGSDRGVKLPYIVQVASTGSEDDEDPLSPQKLKGLAKYNERACESKASDMSCSSSGDEGESEYYSSDEDFETLSREGVKAKSSAFAKEKLKERDARRKRAKKLKAEAKKQEKELGDNGVKSNKQKTATSQPKVKKRILPECGPGGAKPTSAKGKMQISKSKGVKLEKIECPSLTVPTKLSKLGHSVPQSCAPTKLPKIDAPRVFKSEMYWLG